MPQVIQRVLETRLRKSLAWAQLWRDFQELAGLPLTLHSPLGHWRDGCQKCERIPICRWIQEQVAGESHCRRVVQQLLENGSEEPAETLCDAGLVEMVIPIHSGGLDIGYLVTGGFRVTDRPANPVNRARHLLSRSGLLVDMQRLRKEWQQTPEFTRERVNAIKRWLSLAARQLAREVSEEFDIPPTESSSALPGPIQRAVGWIQGHCAESINLQKASQVAGLSPGHFSRLFHQTTGLKFSEYVAHTRLRRACDLLATTRMSISQIAFNSGFSSISQFNRSFRKGVGTSPKVFRQNSL